MYVGWGGGKICYFEIFSSWSCCPVFLLCVSEMWWCFSDLVPMSFLVLAVVVLEGVWVGCVLLVPLSVVSTTFRKAVAAAAACCTKQSTGVEGCHCQGAELVLVVRGVAFVCFPLVAGLPE